MGPSRKRPRTKTPTATEEPPDTNLPLEQASTSSARPSTSAANSLNNVKDAFENAPTSMRGKKADPSSSSLKQLKQKSSWYGTWPRKSTASTQVARESILAENPANGTLSTDLSRFEPKKSPVTSASRPPSMMIGKSKKTLDITMGGTLDGEERSNVEPQADESSSSNNAPPANPTVPVKEPASEPPTQPPVVQETTQRPLSSSGWLGGWFGGPPPSLPPTIPEATPQRQPESESLAVPVPEVVQPQPEPVIQSPEPVPPPPPSSSSSWFGLWSSATPVPPEVSKVELPVKMTETSEDTVMEDAPVSVQPPKEPAPPAAGSSWAFWSKDTGKKDQSSGEKASGSNKTTGPEGKAEESGQLAVTGEASQNHPEPAKTQPVKEAKKSKSSKRVRPQSVEIDEATHKALSEPATSKAISSGTSTPAKVTPPNLLLPSVRSTYRLVENPSILQQIARLLFHGKQQPVKHLFMVKDPPKIRKALAIGIHGLFPAPLLRTVIGQPTGTSIRFANHAADAIRRWADKHGSTDCEVDKVALEGEGKIGERVDNLWKLLLNWVTHVKHADFVLVACHSQGVPVAVMLVAKLIELGVVSGSRIGICAMAGVSLGPFPDYKSRLFSGSAGELFDFANPESVVSKKYEDALRVALKYGVRVTYCGSIDDQLVSMESSIFSTAEHPYIYRAVFVDGRIHAPDFLSHLVGFALKLRNLGVSDHGLIRELSAPLAGSLYTGEGHSRLYDDGNVYDLAVEYALETTSVGDVPLNLKKYEIPTNSNPYVLPWIMRGLLEEDFVKTELDHETTELLKQFDDWKPATKVLKDVKYRLEAVRSKL